MKFSDRDLTILRNFSEINQNSILLPGKVQRTNANKTIFARSTFDYNFPHKVTLHNLNQFLSIFNLFSNPDLDFNETFVNIVSEGSSAKFYYSDPAVVKLSLPANDRVFTNPYDTMSISKDQLAKIRSSSKIYGSETFMIDSSGDEVFLRIINSVTNSDMRISLGTSSKKYQGIINMANLLILPDAYDVEVYAGSPYKFLILKSRTHGIEYIIPFEKGSKFDV